MRLRRGPKRNFPASSGLKPNPKELPSFNNQHESGGLGRSSDPSCVSKIVGRSTGTNFFFGGQSTLWTQDWRPAFGWTRSIVIPISTWIRSTGPAVGGEAGTSDPDPKKGQYQAPRTSEREPSLGPRRGPSLYTPQSALVAEGKVKKVKKKFEFYGITLVSSSHGRFK